MAQDLPWIPKERNDPVTPDASDGELQALARKRQQELSILSTIALRIHEEEDPQTVIEIALDELVSGLGVKAAWVFLGDQREKKLRFTRRTVSTGPPALHSSRREARVPQLMRRVTGSAALR